MKVKLIYIIAAIFLFSTPILAQRGQGSRGGIEPSDDPDVPTTPIDGGLSVLIVGGIAYGIHELRKKKE